MVAIQDVPKRILIILMGSLGDVVRGLSVADGLKAKFPTSHITWLVEPKCLDLVRLSPCIDSILMYERHTPIKGLLTLLPKLRDFDLVLDMQRHFKSGFFSWWTGAPRRIGFHRKDSKEANWIFNTEYIDYLGMYENKFLHYQKFLERLGISPQRTTTLQSIELPTHIKNLANVVSIVVSTSWESKNWVGEGYKNLIDKLVEKKYQIVLTGDVKDKLMGEELKKHFPDIISLIGNTSLAELVSLIKKSRFMVGPDSGPGHIAAAVKTPYISLFGPTSSKRVAPFGFEDLVVQAEIGCSPCYRRRCPGLNRLCMRLISVDAIMKKVALVEQR